jgi:hypothetical protein
VEVARVGYVLGTLEHGGEGSWSAVSEGTPVAIGDAFRTGPESRARFDFPWMSVAIDSESLLRLPDAAVLSAVLEEGRVEPFSPRGSIIKVVTAEASVRGAGRVVVRRDGVRTRVSVLEGRFAVEPPGEVAIEVPAGKGLILVGGEPPGPVLDLAAPPEGLNPGEDPSYLQRGGAAVFEWRGDAPAYRVELLGFDGEDVILGRDVAQTTTSMTLPWLGTFRWRVSALDARGLEGRPSGSGSICVVEE